MSSSAKRAEWRERRTNIINNWAAQHGQSVVSLNSGYQLRIGSILDIYPTNGRWHIIFTGERGDWHVSKKELQALYDKALKDSGIVERKLTDVFIPNTQNKLVPAHDAYRLAKIKAADGDGDSAKLVAQIEETARKQSMRWWKFWRWFE